MKYIYEKRPSNIGGFTLVETLVAISILLIAIVGPMTIAARGLQTAFFAREQITAFSLAQEGVELVRMLRDQNALSGALWLAGIPSGLCGSADGCGLDVRGGPIRTCNGNNCRLRYDDNVSLLGKRGFYNYTDGALSLYTRRIFVKPIIGAEDREAEITVTVTWQSGLLGGEKTVTIQSRLFNQYDNL